MEALDKVVICQQCGKKATITTVYTNKNTGEIWCTHCLTVEKKKREKRYPNSKY